MSLAWLWRLLPDILTAWCSVLVRVVSLLAGRLEHSSSSSVLHTRDITLSACCTCCSLVSLSASSRMWCVALVSRCRCSSPLVELSTSLRKVSKCPNPC